MSLLNTLSTGLSGLRVASTGIATTTQNVSNATVQGFTRRTADVSTADPIQRGLVWLGQGAKVDGISRAADPFALARLFDSTGDANAASAEHAALSQIEPLFESAMGTSFKGTLDGIFDALTMATADPSDLGLRANVVSALQTFSDAANVLGTGLEAGIADRASSALATVDLVNADLEEVATLNDRILEAGGPGAAADLADRRDLALTRLAENIGASVYFERDGSATVRIGGHAAVSGGVARTVGAEDDPLGSGRTVLTLSVDEGAVVIQADGGKIGGEMAAQDKLESWLSDLDTLVESVATELNAAHAAGFTPGGASGGDLFTLPGSGSAASGLRVDSALLADPESLAFASTSAGLPGDGGNLSSLIGLQDAAIVNGLRPTDAASQLVTRVGTDVTRASARAESTQATALDAAEVYSNLSAVDLDEEAVSLLQYQAAYQAAAKVIQVTDETLNALMSII
ncbi:MAG: flagellar hook-associated protein FlgK [Myxococcota bacterium]